MKRSREDGQRDHPARVSKIEEVNNSIQKEGEEESSVSSDSSEEVESTKKKMSKDARRKKDVKKDKKRKKKHKKKHTKESKKKRDRHEKWSSTSDDDEFSLKHKQQIDELDRQSRDLADALGQHRSGRLSENEQASLLHADLATRAAALGLPKGLIRTTGGAGSGLFSSSGKFGDQKTRRELAGGAWGGGDNPATAARMKRERQAQKAEKRAREILREREASTQAEEGLSSCRGGGGTGSLMARFNSGAVQR